MMCSSPAIGAGAAQFGADGLLGQSPNRVGEEELGRGQAVGSGNR